VTEPTKETQMSVPRSRSGLEPPKPLEGFGPSVVSQCWDFLRQPLLSVTRAILDAERGPELDPRVKARQNGILVDLFAAMDEEQARQDRLERALKAGHAARDRARRNGKGRSRAAQRRRAAHARLADECPTCFDSVCARAARLRESRRLLAALDARVEREARAWNERIR
jgi:hypothetical protein